MPLSEKVAALFYNTFTTSMVVLPTTVYDSGFTFDGIMTADFQGVNVQGDIAYTISDYEKTFLALMDGSKCELRAGSDAWEARWFDIELTKTEKKAD